MDKGAWLDAFVATARRLDGARALHEIAALGRDAWAVHGNFNPKLVAYFEVGEGLSAMARDTAPPNSPLP